MEGLFSSSNPFKRRQQAADENQVPPAQQEEEVKEKRKGKNVESRKQRSQGSSPPCQAGPSTRKRKNTEQQDDEVPAKRPAIEQEEPDGTNLEFDSDEKLRRTIFVGNLPIKIKKKALVREFSTYGSVQSARLRSVPVGTLDLPRTAALSTGQVNESRSSMNAYVVFEDEESATAALAHNMKLLGDKHIRVDLAQPPGGKKRARVTYDKTRSIFLGNVPFDVEEEEIYALFPTDEIEAIRVVRDQRTNVGKGFAFVLFKSEDGLSQALSRRSLEVRSRKLRVRRLKRVAIKPHQPASRAGYKEKQLRQYEGARSGKKQRRMVRAQQPAMPTATRDTTRKRPAVAARKAAQHQVH